jgi:hypothetical protein
MALVFSRFPFLSEDFSVASPAKWLSIDNSGYRSVVELFNRRIRGCIE